MALFLRMRAMGYRGLHRLIAFPHLSKLHPISVNKNIIARLYESGIVFVLLLLSFVTCIKPEKFSVSHEREGGYSSVLTSRVNGV